MKKLTLLLSILCGCILTVNVAQAANSNKCSRLMVNHTDRVLNDKFTGLPNSPGQSVFLPINCTYLGANYELGAHKYFNRQFQFYATTIRDPSTPNSVTIIISDK